MSADTFVMCNGCGVWKKMQAGNHHPWCACGSDNFRWEDERDHDPEAALTEAQPAPAAPFPKGGWQHAVDDSLVNHGKTSEEFASPHDAIAWLMECERAVAIALAPAAQPADSAMRQAIEALRSAETWLEGWASAEPYLSEIRRALAAFDALEKP